MVEQHSICAGFCTLHVCWADRKWLVGQAARRMTRWWSDGECISIPSTFIQSWSFILEMQPGPSQEWTVVEQHTICAGFCTLHVCWANRRWLVGQAARRMTRWWSDGECISIPSTFIQSWSFILEMQPGPSQEWTVVEENVSSTTGRLVYFACVLG